MGTRVTRGTAAGGHGDRCDKGHCCRSPHSSHPTPCSIAGASPPRHRGSRAAAPALTAAPAAPGSRAGSASPLAAVLQRPLDPGILICGTGNGPGLSAYSDTSSSLTPGPASREKTPGKGLWAHRHHPCKRGGRYKGTCWTRQWLYHSHTRPSLRLAPHRADPRYHRRAECTHGCSHPCWADRTS